MARGVVRRLKAEPLREPALGYRRIAAFYTPLALTSVVGLTIDPMLTFFMGRSRLPVLQEQLALLQEGLEALFEDVRTGRKRFLPYQSLKLYGSDAPRQK